MKTVIRKKKPEADLLAEIRAIISSARSHTVRSINSLQVVSNFLIGMRIVIHEQKGSTRAAYGKRIIEDLSQALSMEFGKGYSRSNLEYMRKFYLSYHAKITQPISQTLSGNSLVMSQKTLQNLAGQWSLSWSHYLLLMGIKNAEERAFYEIESAEQNWSLTELRRQYNSSLYERLALSRDKKGVKKLSLKGLVVEQPKDVLKNPLVLEFLGLPEKHHFSESDLESAIIDKLELFLLEMGKGFLFEARQKRFSFDEENFFVDLVFYNRLLRCYVLIDLKIGKLTHQDLGQMQMYVNYFDRYVKRKDEKPTIGIVLCKEKKDALVEITLPKGSKIHASEYQLYLPSKEELKMQLKEAAVQYEAFHG